MTVGKKPLGLFSDMNDARKMDYLRQKIEYFDDELFREIRGLTTSWKGKRELLQEEIRLYKRMYGKLEDDVLRNKKELPNDRRGAIMATRAANGQKE
jgi:hypothetical protein